jgi:hypothetical protein
VLSRVLHTEGQTIGRTGTEKRPHRRVRNVSVVEVGV